MAIQLRPDEREVQRIVDAVIQLVQGRMNAVGEVTLAAGAALTAVTWVNCSTDSRIFLMPETANAAAAVATTYIVRAEIIQSGFTIRHANNAQTDRTFSFLCIGG